MKVNFKTIFSWCQLSFPSQQFFFMQDTVNLVLNARDSGPPSQHVTTQFTFVLWVFVQSTCYSQLSLLSGL